MTFLRSIATVGGYTGVSRILGRLHERDHLAVRGPSRRGGGIDEPVLVDDVPLAVAAVEQDDAGLLSLEMTDEQPDAHALG